MSQKRNVEASITSTSNPRVSSVPSPVAPSYPFGLIPRISNNPSFWGESMFTAMTSEPPGRRPEALRFPILHHKHQPMAFQPSPLAHFSVHNIPACPSSGSSSVRLFKSKPLLLTLHSNSISREIRHMRDTIHALDHPTTSPRKLRDAHDVSDGTCMGTHR